MVGKSGRNSFAILCVTLILLAGCANAGRLNARLNNYHATATNEPIDSPGNDREMVKLMCKMEPLTAERDIQAVLNVALLCDATDNKASSVARELLVKYRTWALPIVQRRLQSDLNPNEVRYLLAQMGEKSYLNPEPETLPDAKQ